MGDLFLMQGCGDGVDDFRFAVGSEPFHRKTDALLKLVQEWAWQFFCQVPHLEP